VAPPIPAHLTGTLEALRQAGRNGLSTAAVQAATGGAAATVLDRLGALERRGQVSREGAGVKGAPLVWRATEHPPGEPKPPTADPAYVRYLGSATWARKRAEILTRAAGRCEACGAGVPDGEAEVHHRTYERAGRELPDDLAALCPGCHRRAHSRGGASGTIDAGASPGALTLRPQASSGAVLASPLRGSAAPPRG
jgi:hypothetical protein